MNSAKLFGRSVKYGYSLIKDEITFTQGFKTVLMTLRRLWGRNWKEKEGRSFCDCKFPQAVDIE
jgi:hypothetical protein